MAGAFTAVNLAKLPFPNAVEALDYEIILSEMVEDLRTRDPLFSALVESDPAYKVLEVAAYRETLLRQRANEAVKAVTLAYAEDDDLDHIAARYNVQRLVITPPDPNTIPPTDAVMEDNESLRRRVQLSFEGFSTAGPEGAYIFHALGADSLVLDAAVYGPPEMPGVVLVAVLSREGDGTPTPELLEAVEATLSADDVRPLTDQVFVQAAEIVSYEVDAALTLYNGPDANVVLETARNTMKAYADEQHRLGRSITLSGIYAALHQEGVQGVQLTSPAGGIAVTWSQAAYCSAINLTIAGSNDE